MNLPAALSRKMVGIGSLVPDFAAAGLRAVVAHDLVIHQWKWLIGWVVPQVRLTQIGQPTAPGRVDA